MDSFGRIAQHSHKKYFRKLRLARNICKEIDRLPPDASLIDEIRRAIDKRYSYMTIEMSYSHWLDFSALYPSVYYRELLGKDLQDSFTLAADKVKLRDECRGHGGFFTLDRQWVNVEFV